MKKLLNHIFIDGLSGMALGLFSTLIVGTIIQQIGNLIGGNIGDMLFIMGKMAAAMTGAGIGVGVAHRYQESPLVVLSAATAGMTGGFASKILAAGPVRAAAAFARLFAGWQPQRPRNAGHRAEPAGPLSGAEVRVPAQHHGGQGCGRDAGTAPAAGRAVRHRGGTYPTRHAR